MKEKQAPQGVFLPNPDSDGGAGIHIAGITIQPPADLLVNGEVPEGLRVRLQALGGQGLGWAGVLCSLPGIFEEWRKDHTESLS